MVKIEGSGGEGVIIEIDVERNGICNRNVIMVRSSWYEMSEWFSVLFNVWV